jgi:hypothetical protein
MTVNGDKGRTLPVHAQAEVKEKVQVQVQVQSVGTV